jgi:aspartate ammonia-lyase
VTLLNPILGYKQCAEIARDGYQHNKSIHQIVVQEKQLLTQQPMGRNILVRKPDPAAFHRLSEQCRIFAAIAGAR